LVKVDEQSTMTRPASADRLLVRPAPADAPAVLDLADGPAAADGAVYAAGAPDVADHPPAAPDPLEPLEPVEPGRLRRWWDSRLGYRLILEVGLMYGLYFVYKIVRYQGRDNVGDAVGNARQVIHVERAIGIFTEVDVQQLALQSTDLVRWLNRYYLVAHFTVSMICFVWLYVRRPAGYAKCRRILIGLTLLGLVVHVAYPLAPPRMFSDMGFVDTAKLFGPDTYGEGSHFKALANQFAAMPSLHFGWSVLVAYAAVRFSKSRLRFVAVAHPVLTLAAIVLTANHYWLDAIVAFFLLLLVFVVDPWLARLRMLLTGRVLPRLLPRPRRRSVVSV
jgi:hypothetical protein